MTTGTHALKRLGISVLSGAALAGAVWAGGKAPAPAVPPAAGKPTPFPASTQPDKETIERIKQQYAQMPLSFEVNRGQAGQDVKFLSRGDGYQLYLTPRSAVLGLRKHTPGKKDAGRVSLLGMGLIGANQSPEMTGVDALPGRSNYFIGNDASQWRQDITNYRKVRYSQVYPGIDLIYYGNQRQLEYDFIVAPGESYRQIEMAFAGARKLSVDRKGDLVLELNGGAVRQKAPVTYQEVDGKRRIIPSRYVLRGKNRVGFNVGAYDRSKTLVIDPVLRYSSYLGGSDGDFATGIAVDSSGNAYVTGYTVSFNQNAITQGTQNPGPVDPPTDGPSTAGFPVVNGFSGDPDLWSFLPGRPGVPNYDFATFEDAFVTKLNPDGTGLVYSTYFGGGGNDRGHAITLNAAGEAFITGVAGPPLVPHTHSIPLFRPTQSRSAGGADAFVVRFNAAGNGIIYSTYVGGSGEDSAFGIGVDSRNNAIITGETNSSDFNTYNALQPNNAGGWDAFVTSLNTSGSNFNYSTYLGGPGTDAGLAIVGDPDGNAYVTGATDSATFPTTPAAFQGAFGGGTDAFVVKVNPSGDSLVYATFLGGSAGEIGRGIAIDSARNAYVTGETASSNFPVLAPAFQANNAGGFDAFVTKLNTGGSALLFSTYLGGTGTDRAYAIAVSAGSQAYVTGETSSSDFPILNHVQAGRLGSTDAFVAKFDRPGTGLEYSTYFGGEDSGFVSNQGFFGNRGRGIAVDPTGTAFVTGWTSSYQFPRTIGAFQQNLARPSYSGTQVGGPEPPRIVNAYGPYARVDVFIARFGSPPLAPSQLAVTTVTQTSVGLAWIDNSDNETSWEIERKTPSTNFVLAGTANSNQVTFNNTGLTPNTTYTFRVRAVNGDGQSPYSNQVTVTTLPDPPAAPTGLTVTTIDKNRLKLDWTDGSNNEDSFVIQRRRVTAPSTSFADVQVLGANTVTFTDTGLTPNTKYEYRVKASNAGGDSAWLGPVEGTTFPDTPTIAPANLTATPKSSSEIDLAWLYTPTDATGFKIERSTDGGVTFTLLRITSTTATTFTDTGLTANTTYHYKVRAYNASGDGPFSNVASATTLPDPPAAPANLAATAVSTSQINLTWSDASSNETGFNIERSTDGTTFTEIGQVGTGVTTYSDTGLLASTKYYYRVRARNTGGFSAYSNTAEATTLEGPPPAPTNLTAAPRSSSEIDLAWTDAASNESGFKIERSTDGGMTFTEIAQVGPNIQAYTDSGLQPDTDYHYRVRAYSNTNGDGAYSNVASARTLPLPPGAPSNLTVTTVSQTQLDLSWTDNSSNETGFKIERSADGTTFTEIGQVGAGVTTYSDTGLTAATTYYYRVRAFGAGGDGAYSNVASGTTLPNRPGAPGGLKVTVLSASELKLDWSDNSQNETGFLIFRKTGTGAFAQVAQVGANVKTYTDTGLSPNTTYTYQVAALNAGGTSSPSNNASGLTLPAAPTGLSATASPQGKVTLQWSHTGGADGFKIQRKTAGPDTFREVGRVAGGATSFSETPGAGVEYVYRVIAYNASGDSAPSNEASITPPVSLWAVGVNPSTVRRGKTAQGVVALTGPAPTATTVSLRAVKSKFGKVPASVTIPAGARSATFTFKAGKPRKEQQVVVEASSGGVTVTTTVTVTR